MPSRIYTDAQLVEAFKRLGSPSLVAREFGVTERGVLARRAALASRGTILESHTDARLKYTRLPGEIEGRKTLDIEDGYIISGSDAHYFPGYAPTAHRALVAMAKELRPKAIVLNGDMVDGASISRHARIGWDRKPTVQEELQVVEERLTEIEEAAPNARRYWLLGNHDARYETCLAANAPQYEGVPGFKLKDRFPLWIPCWVLFVNEHLVYKHRYKGGVHAGHNNALWSGRTIVTGHDHLLKVTPIVDYNGKRWGVQGGMMAACYGPQFEDYMEGNPRSWQSGIVIVRIKNGELYQPQTLHVVDEDAGLVEWGLERFTV